MGGEGEQKGCYPMFKIITSANCVVLGDADSRVGSPQILLCPGASNALSSMLLL